MQVARNELTSLQGLAAAPALESLNCVANPLPTLTSLPSRLPELAELFLRDCSALTSLAALGRARAPSLACLHASGCSLGSVEDACASLSSLPALVHLEISESSSVERDKAGCRSAAVRITATAAQRLPRLQTCNGLDVTTPGAAEGAASRISAGEQGAVPGNGSSDQHLDKDDLALGTQIGGTNVGSSAAAADGPFACDMRRFMDKVGIRARAPARTLQVAPGDQSALSSAGPRNAADWLGQAFAGPGRETKSKAGQSRAGERLHNAAVNSIGGSPRICIACCCNGDGLGRRPLCAHWLGHAGLRGGRAVA